MVDLETVMDQLVSLLSVDLTVVDLSATGKVLRGRYAEPPANFDGFIGICSPTIASEQGPTIRQFVRRCDIQIDGWVACEQETTAHRAERGEALVDAILTALEDGRFDNANAGGIFDCREFVAEATNFEADFDPVPRGYARVIVNLTLSYARDRGI